MNNDFHTLLECNSNECLLTNAKPEKNIEAFLIKIRRELEKAIVEGVRSKKWGEDWSIPSFALQGSYVYKTLIKPNHPPEQELDLDLGVYMPFSDLGDGKQPQKNVKDFFSLIEGILFEYLENHEYLELEIIDPKKTCVRVRMKNYPIHFDLPLYGIPSEMLDQKKAVFDKSEMAILREGQFIDESLIFASDGWAEDIEPTAIHLAMRDEGWRPSDPLRLQDWIKSEIRVKRERVRSITKLLKLWRDQQYKGVKGAPSSIFLLAHTIKYFGSAKDKNISEHFIEVAKKLPESINGPLEIPAPTPEDPNAMEDIASEDRIGKWRTSQIVQVQNLISEWDKCLTDTDPSRVNLRLKGLFGKFTPHDPRRISLGKDSPVTFADYVRQSPPKTVPLRTSSENISG